MTTGLSAVQQHVDAARVLEIEQGLLRIPSSAFQEHQIADHLADGACTDRQEKRHLGRGRRARRRQSV